MSNPGDAVAVFTATHGRAEEAVDTDACDAYFATARGLAAFGEPGAAPAAVPVEGADPVARSAAGMTALAFVLLGASSGAVVEPEKRRRRPPFGPNCPE